MNLHHPTPVAATLLGAGVLVVFSRMPFVDSIPWIGWAFGLVGFLVHMLVVSMALGSVVGLAVLPFLVTRHSRRRMSAFWQGGMENDPIEEYMGETAASLTYLIRRQVQIAPPGLSPSQNNDYLPATVILAESTIPAARQVVVERFRAVLNALIHILVRSSQRFAETVQNGDIRRYMAYILAVYLISLILFMLTLQAINH
jgi:hypothetical protein